MPNFTLEYSANILEPVTKELLQEMHLVLAETGPFNLQDIKSRAVRLQEYCIAEGSADKAFVIVQLALLPGRQVDDKKAASDRLLVFLKKKFASSLDRLNCAISVELREMDRETYRKAKSGEA